MLTRIVVSRPQVRCSTTRRQSGAAALVVVLILLLVVALAAGYANRNLIFEQRISSNQYRSTQALEAAEAGIEWALAMLNAGRIDSSCQPVADPASAAPSFRQRYLMIAPDTGVFTARTRADGTPLRPACVFDGADWNCSCPVDGAPTLTAPAGPGPYPAFRLQIISPAGLPPGVARLEAVGCTRLDATDVCAPAAASGDGRAGVTVLVALRSGLTTPPAAGVTTQADLDIGAGLLEVSHTDPASGGVTLHAGGTITGSPIALHTPPGWTPAQSVVDGDANLATLADKERMFANVFGMARGTYRQQPGTVIVDCALDCSAGRVRDIVRLNPGRIVWIEGDFDLDAADAIGTTDLPALLVVDGTFTVSDPAAQLTGAVYAIDPAWSSTAGSSLALRGGIVAESGLSLAGAGVTHVVYDLAVLTRLRTTHGSLVRVPGSWKDF